MRRTLLGGLLAGLLVVAAVVAWTLTGGAGDDDARALRAGRTATDAVVLPDAAEPDATAPEALQLAEPDSTGAAAAMQPPDAAAAAGPATFAFRGRVVDEAG